MVIDFPRKIMIYLDSLIDLKNQTKYTKDVETIFKSVIPLVKAIRELNQVKFQIEDWKMYAPKDITQQKDGCNCGVFVCV